MEEEELPKERFLKWKRKKRQNHFSYRKEKKAE